MCMDWEWTGISDAHQAIRPQPVNPSTTQSHRSPKPLIPSHHQRWWWWESMAFFHLPPRSLTLFLYLFHSCFPFLLLSGSCCKERGRVQLFDSRMQFIASSSSLRIEYGFFLVLKRSLQTCSNNIEWSLRGQPFLRVKYVPGWQQVQMSYPLVKRLQHWPLTPFY